jgi:hypothetical protein
MAGSLDNVEAIKARLAETASVIRERIEPWIKLEVFVAQDIPGFNDFPADIGWYGHRVSKYN